MREHPHSRHLWIMLACCLIPIVAAATISLLHLPMSIVILGSLVLLCPLTHLLLMNYMMGRPGLEQTGENHRHRAHVTNGKQPWYRFSRAIGRTWRRIS